MFIPKTWTSFKQYSWDTFRKDLLAGIVVGVVALPLAMAFGIASGVTPAQGIYTAIIAGFLISFFSGSKVQIGGPTGAFVVIIFGIIQRQGYDGLVLATLMAAFLLIMAGVFRLGTWIKFIPYPLVMGFTTGIAVVIFSTQIKDFFGFKSCPQTVNFLEQWEAYIKGCSTFDWKATTLASGTLFIIILVRRFFPRIPWGIGAIVLATLVVYLFDLPVETIASRFGKIPNTLPHPTFPTLHFDLKTFQNLIPDAFVIAFLAGVESLLSAVIADGMTGGRHKSNCELVAQGIGNLGSICFGGIPATAAIARTATNIKTGAKTPVAGLIHALILLLIILVFAPLVEMIPLSAIPAILMMVAWNMAELGHFKRLLKAPPGDVLVLLATFILTILVDITVAVAVGMVFASFLFMKRMSDLSPKIALTPFVEENEENDPEAISKKEVPKDVEVYEINGPLFFGVADSLKNVLHNIERSPKVFILRMRKVPVIDASGLHALKEFYYKCKQDGTILILSGVKGQPRKSLEKFGMTELLGKENILQTIDKALHRAKEITRSL